MKTYIPIRQLLKVISLIILFSISSLLLNAQNPILLKQWDYRYGGTDYEYLLSFRQTADSGFILGGYSFSGISGDKTEPSQGNYDYWVVKTNALGIKQWDKRFGGIDDDKLISVRQTSDGGFILGGASNSGIGGDKTQPSQGDYDYWIVKIDSLGNKQWDKRFGGDLEDDLCSTQQTTDGGYILSGFSYSGISGDKTQPNWDVTNAKPDLWIIKVDSLGIKQWDKRFGGTSSDFGGTIQQTTDGGYILASHSYSPISGDKTQANWAGVIDADLWIVKMDSLGNKQWDKRFGGTYFDAGGIVKQTPDGGYILKCTSYSDISGDRTQPLLGVCDYWLVKIDAAGNKQWDKRYGGNDYDVFYDVFLTSDNGYLLSGYSQSNISGEKSENNMGQKQAWIVKADSLGTKKWDRTILMPGNVATGLAIQTNDGCYAIASTTYSGIGGYQTQTSWGYGDYWITKLCQLFAPVAQLSSSDTSFCEKQCLDFYDMSVNNPTSWQWFFPGSNTPTSTLQNPVNVCYNNYGSFDVTLLAYNSAGCDTLVLTNFINVYSIPAPVITQSNDTLFSSPGSAYQWWSVSSGLIAGATNNYFVPTQAGDYYVIVTDSVGCQGASNTITITGINEEANGKGQMAIVPNPNDGSFTITLNTSLKKDFSLRIINPMGQTVYKKQDAIPIATWSNGQEAINVEMSNIAQGLYVAEVINDGKVYRTRFIVQ